MPTIITHALTGYLATYIFRSKRLKQNLIIWSLLCPVIPDLDVITFAFEISYGDFWGHRGFSHSLVFALVLSVIIVVLVFRSFALRGKPKIFLILYFFVLTASHGILDALRGSTTEQVLRGCSCPVLAVPTAGGEQTPPSG